MTEILSPFTLEMEVFGSGIFGKISKVDSRKRHGYTLSKLQEDKIKHEVIFLLSCKRYLAMFEASTCQ